MVENRRKARHGGDTRKNKENGKRKRKESKASYGGGCIRKSKQSKGKEKGKHNRKQLRKGTEGKHTKRRGGTLNKLKGGNKGKE